MIVLLVIAWLISENRRGVPARTVIAGLALQLVLAILLLKLPPVRDLFLALNGIVQALQQATLAGTSFVLGYLGGGDIPFEARHGASTFILAFQALPLVLVMSALSALLYHWRVLPLVVRGFAWCLQRTLGIGGAAGVGTAANVFVGMVEAPLLVRPYLATTSRSDLFVIMAAGMATIAGTMMVLYASFLDGVIADPLGHILTASVLNAPAAIVIARLMVPPETDQQAEAVTLTNPYDSAMDAVTRGTLDGLTLLLNIGAMLIVLVALVALANAALGLLPDWGGAAITLQRLLGYALARLAGTSYGELVAKQITGPLRMTDTVVALSEEQRSRLARGHAGGMPVPNWSFDALAGAGALRSTARDLVAFLRADLGHAESSIALALGDTHQGRSATDVSGLAVALGWHVWSRHGSEIFWHNGGTGGYHSFCGFNPKSGRGVVVLTGSNVDVDDIGLHLLEPAFELKSVRAGSP